MRHALSLSCVLILAALLASKAHASPVADAPPSTVADPVDAADSASKAGHVDEALRILTQADSPAAGPRRLEIQARRGNFLRRLSRLDEAESLLQRVAADAHRAKDLKAEGLALHYLGRLAIDRSQSKEALARLTRSEAALQKLGTEPVELEKVRLSLAGVQADRDDVLGAYERYDAVLESAAARGDERQQAMVLLSLSGCLVAAGRPDQALPVVRQARSLFAHLQDRPKLAQAQATEALFLDTLGRGDEALATVRALDLEGLQVGATERLSFIEAQGTIEGRRGDRARGLEVLQNALHTPGFDRPGAVRTRTLLVLAQLLLDLGRAREAQVAVAELTGADIVPGMRFNWVVIRGQIADALGDLPAAEALYGEAVDALESAWETAEGDALVRLNDFPTVHRAYERLVDLQLRKGDASAALRTLDRQKARALSETIREAWKRDTPVAAGPQAPPSPRTLDTLEGLLRRAHTPAAGRASESAFPEKTAVLEFRVTDQNVDLFWRDADGVRHVRSPETASAWRDATIALLQGISARTGDWEDPADRLGAWTLGPFAAVFERAAARGDTLVLIPHGFTHALPFPALRYQKKFLDDWLTTAEEPGMGLLQTRTAANRAGTPLIVGDVADTDHGALPSARRELEQVQKRLGGQRLTGAAATVSGLAHSVAGRSTIHFALHGFRADEKSPGFLQLTPGAGSDSGRLDAFQVARLDLSARLVFLSACETAVGRLSPGDEAFTILDRAFLMAGARTVVSTKWSIDDRATLTLVDAFYAAWPRTVAPEALRSARRHLRGLEMPGDAVGLNRGLIPVDAGETVRWAHPYYWAAFKVAGALR